MFDLYLSLLKFIYGRVDLREHALGLGPEVDPAGDVRDLGQGLLIDVCRRVHVARPPDRVVHRDRTSLRSPHGDRVYLDTERPRRLCSGDRVYLTGVVSPVRQENDDPALGVALAKSVRGGRNSKPYRRALLVDHPDLDGLQKFDEDAMIEGQRTLREALAREHDHSDPVGDASLNEARHHFLGHGETIQRLEILSSHAPGDIHGKHDVDALGQHRLGTAPRLGAPQRQNQCGQHGRPQGCPRIPFPGRATPARGFRQIDQRVTDRRVHPPGEPERHEEIEADQQQKPQKLRIREPEHASTPPP